MNITTQIQGGLGNQLFQYATGKALSLRLKRQLLLDIDWFNHSWDDVTPRKFLLHDLKLNYDIAPTSDISKPPKRWRRIAQQLLPLNPYVINERPFRFNPNINTFTPYKSQNIYLMGYWQSYRYFDNIRKELIAEIRPKSGVSAHYQEYVDKIQSTHSAMIHIRRGDYVHLPVATKIHGFLGLEYYKEGIKILSASDPATQFFVFSDDIDWAKANLSNQSKIEFIQSANIESDPIHELFLMTLCKKHLIANSSLSWWGAWLSNSSRPQVIAPKDWTQDKDKHWNNLLPLDWQRI